MLTVAIISLIVLATAAVIVGRGPARGGVGANPLCETGWAKCGRDVADGDDIDEAGPGTVGP